MSRNKHGVLRQEMPEKCGRVLWHCPHQYSPFSFKTKKPWFWHRWLSSWLSHPSSARPRAAACLLAQIAKTHIVGSMATDLLIISSIDNPDKMMGNAAYRRERTGGKIKNWFLGKKVGRICLKASQRQWLLFFSPKKLVYFFSCVTNWPFSRIFACCQKKMLFEIFPWILLVERW